MKTKVVLTSIIIAFVSICGLLVIESGILSYLPAKGLIPLASQTEIDADAAEETTETAKPQDKTLTAPNPEDYDFSEFKAIHAKLETRTLGSLYDQAQRNDDPGKYKFQLEFTSKGASISNVILSEFDDRAPEDAQPLVLLSSPANSSVGNTLANGNFIMVVAGKETKFPLNKLNWKMTGDSIRQPNNSEKIAFEAMLKDANGKEAFKFIKTYRVVPGSYLIECDLVVENLSTQDVNVQFEMYGPGRMSQEDSRSDMRKVIAAYLMPKGDIETEKLDNNKLRKYTKERKSIDAKLKINKNDESAKTTLDNLIEELRLKHKVAGTHYIWGAATNKYFAAILRPVPAQGDWLQGVVSEPASYSDPDDPELEGKKAGDQVSSGFSMKVQDVNLSAAGQDNSSRTFNFQLYMGPKDVDLFKDNPEYNKLAYLKTIDFRTCCCPASVIAPLVFGIMAFMSWSYNAMGPLGNYGVVIMFIVFLVRLLMHPVTKKSQISMMRMQKLGPMMEEIKKKYANNKQEMNKKVMELYKQQGVSPVSSFLPMMIQMPVWISLWTAINTSIELRGAGFLPFWITDLSSPDALIRFSEFTVPFLGWHIDSFNLLPILMGVVMFLQQKLMPHSKATEQTNPQVAQQQKMMMIMMPLMFPIMLYKGPSGVNLYIMSSISAGVIEQIIIRKHIREKEEDESRGLVAVTKKTGGKVKKKKPKPFFKS